MPRVLTIPTSPTIIQNRFNVEYALSFFNIAHQDKRTASIELNIHTKRKGLLGPIQLTREKLNILIITPVISSDLACRKIRRFKRPIFYFIKIYSLFQLKIIFAFLSLNFLSKKLFNFT